jgi:pleiotropic regulator 1
VEDAPTTDEETTIDADVLLARERDDVDAALNAATSSSGASLPANKRARVDSSTSDSSSTALVLASSNSRRNSSAAAQFSASTAGADGMAKSVALALYEKMESEKPQWHAPWKLMRVVSAHAGVVHSLAVDHSNEWFATGAADRMIKIWDLASGQVKVSFTGHIGTVRGLAVSARHPYLFSVGDDKMVKGWDLETNMVTRQFHGHLSGVYCVAMHPTLDLLITGSRDSSLRVWDLRSRNSVHVLNGHHDTVWSVAAQAVEPQVISGSADCTVRTWDLATGKVQAQLTHHKKAIRAVMVHPTEYSFASAGADNIKKWKCPDARFMLNFTGHHAIIDTIACNGSVFFSGGNNGSMRFWDWKTGYCFQESATIPQPGSLAAEAGIHAATFDMTGTRLITAEADKTIKFWREDDTATERTHPLSNDWRVKVREAVKV